MRNLVIYVCLLTGLFYFSEGKPCPEKSRPHKTRCDAFYKCRELPSNSHVWVPIRCKEGLVYEHNVGTCVLPGEDWECITPSELETTTTSPKNADIYIVNNKNDAELLLRDNNDSDENVQIVLDAGLSSEEEGTSNSREELEPEENLSISQFDSSGDGELVDLDGQVQRQNREGETKLTTAKATTASIMSSTVAPSSPIDPNLTAHLQRLSQLIDGLQQTYQKTDKPQLEMRPDQLNAFLAHFDLKNRFDMLNPTESYRDVTTPSSTTQTTQTTPTITVSSTTKSPDPLPEPTVNKTRLQEHLTRHRMQPETKLMLSSTSPFSSYGPGYANSQIVVNRPEGSVMFTLPQYGHSSEQTQQDSHQEQQKLQQPFSTAQSHEYGEHEPKISEETLKTVLELSKQMIAAQNLPKVLPNPAYNSAYYAPPILQPVILSPHNNPYQSYYPMQGYEPQAPPRTHYVHHKKPSNYNKKSPTTTIIHNNVIPVHVSSTSSGEKEVLDTYGNSLGVYPNLEKHNLQNNDPTNGNQMEGNNYYNKFIATMTTARPSSSISVTTMSNQYTGQYGNDFGLTTPSPFAVHPSPATVATYYTPSPHLGEHNVNSVFQSDSYPTAMALDTKGAPAGMFPTQLDPGQVKIRPNSQKIESMEVEADEALNQNYVNGNGNGNGNGNRLGPHVLTYSSPGASGVMGMSHQLAPGSYVEHSYTMSQNALNEQQQQQLNQFKTSYLPRPTPTVSSSIYSDTAGNVGLSMFSTGLGTGMSTGLGHTASGGSGMPMMPSKAKFPTAMGQLVNFNGNFISLDVFRNSILPLMTQSPSAMSDLGNVEVITCQAGVRQPNQTDCTRYFVCSKKDGKVLSYSCPPYTGFNKQTRICDASTYAQCGNLPVFNGYSIEENRRQQIETLKMLAEAKRRQEAALKAQNIANLLQQYGSSQQEPAGNSAASSIEQSMLDSYMLSYAEPSTTPRPALPVATPSPPALAQPSGSVKKRKYYCKEGDKIPDQTSISSYFVCYKNAQGQMRGHKMTCSKALVFCPRTLMCTLASKCTG